MKVEEPLLATHRFRVANHASCGVVPQFPQSCRTSARGAEIWLRFGQHWRSICRKRQMLASFGRKMLVEFGIIFDQIWPNSANVQPIRVEVGQRSAQVGANLGQCSAKCSAPGAMIRQHWGDVGATRRNGSNSDVTAPKRLWGGLPPPVSGCLTSSTCIAEKPHNLGLWDKDPMHQSGSPKSLHPRELPQTFPPASEIIALRCPCLRASAPSTGDSCRRLLRHRLTNELLLLIRRLLVLRMHKHGRDSRGPGEMLPPHPYKIDRADDADRIQPNHA